MVRGTIALLVALAASSPLAAQGGSPRLEIFITDRVVFGTESPATTVSGVLADGHRRDLLHSGWPTVMHARVELWKKGFLGLFEREADIEWDVIIEYSPSSKMYQVRRILDGQTEILGEVVSIEAAEQLVRRPFTAPIRPRSRGGRYFYDFSVDIATLSVSDLEAWQRWVRGEARPAVEGKRNPATALQRGLGSLLSRVLGGETQSYKRRSDTFTAG